MEEADIVLFEENAAVRKRIERVVSAGAALRPVQGYERAEPEVFRGRPQLIGCGLDQLSIVGRWVDDLPFTTVLTWGTRNSASMLRWAAIDRRMGHFVAWPEFASMPRPADLMVAARRLLLPNSSVELADFLISGAARREFRPTSSHELEDVVSNVRALSVSAGLTGRQAERVAVVAHELLMNAMYGAPVAPDGLPKYAHDRKNVLRLLEDEVPTLILETDGIRLGIQVEDRFGRLERQHVFDGIGRGLGTSDVNHALDTSRGGAGLGLFKMFDAAHALFFDVRHGRRTHAMALFDLDVSSRDQRTMPTTICFFED